MYLTDFLASCRRRWWLALLLVVGTAALSFAAFRAIPPDHDAEASLVLIPPKTGEDLAPNRYLELGSLSFSVDVLARSMVSADTANRLEDEVPLAEYDVTPDPTTSAPIVLMSATSTDRASAARMLKLLLKEIPQTLDELQDEIDVQPKDRITTQVVAQDPKPVVNNKARVRLVAAVGAGLLFASGLLVATVDGLLIRRSRRRAAPRPAGSEGATGRPRSRPAAPRRRPRKPGVAESPPVRNGSPSERDPTAVEEDGREKHHLTGVRRDPAR